MRASCSLCARARTAGAVVVQRERLAAYASRLASASEPCNGSHGCERSVVDAVATAAECRRAIAAVQRAVDTTGTMALPLDIPAAEDLYGASGVALLSELRQRMARQVQQRIPDATVTGTLVSCITGSREARTSGDDDYTFAPHVDKANRDEYDVTALLYLTTHGEDHEGGLFAFNDAERDHTVVPQAGRLLTFCSGFSNLHQVQEVRSGRRMVLSVWFRRQAEALPARSSGVGGRSICSGSKSRSSSIRISSRSSSSSSDGGASRCDGVGSSSGSDVGGSGSSSVGSSVGGISGSSGVSVSGGSGVVDVGGSSGSSAVAAAGSLAPLAADAQPRMDRDGFEVARRALGREAAAAVRAEAVAQAEARR